MNAQSDHQCRLCGGPTSVAFRKKVLGKHDVTYFRCGQCGSMQTEYPYWLDEAYAIQGVHIDVGCGSRTLKNWLAVTTLLDRLGHPRDSACVDFGAATGLFGRLMRDAGYNFYSQDKYAVPSFSNYHHVKDIASSSPAIITAFEVFEHLPVPRQELADLLALGAPLLIFTTWLCDGEGDAWIYLVPECGQHVFFYSKKGLTDLAAAHGYVLQSSMMFHMLVKPSAMTTEQLATIDDFVEHGNAHVLASAGDLISRVYLGNDYVMADFEDAQKRFSLERREANSTN